MGLEVDLDKELGDGLLSEMLFNDNKHEETKINESMMRKEAEMVKFNHMFENRMKQMAQKVAQNVSVLQAQKDKKENPRDIDLDFDDLHEIEDMDDTDEHVQ